MVYGNKSAFRTPLIGRVVYLNKQLAHYGRLLPSGKKRKTASGEVRMTVDIRRYYFTPLLEKGNTLFVYAMRQLKGKDYLKRSVELIEEIQAQCFLMMELHGWNGEVCADLDMICDDIANQLYSLSKGQDKEARVIKPKGENERV